MISMNKTYAVGKKTHGLRWSFDTAKNHPSCNGNDMFYDQLLVLCPQHKIDLTIFNLTYRKLHEETRVVWINWLNPRKKTFRIALQLWKTWVPLPWIPNSAWCIRALQLNACSLKALSNWASTSWRYVEPSSSIFAVCHVESWTQVFWISEFDHGT